MYVAEGGFDAPTSGLWAAHHAYSAPICWRPCSEMLNVSFNEWEYIRQSIIVDFRSKTRDC